MAAVKKAAKFRKIFEPEFLQARKDITPMMMECAKGNTEAVRKMLASKDGNFDMFRTNRDLNTPLLMAVANGHHELTNVLLEAKSELAHKNGMGMDAMDFAMMEGIKSSVAKVVLSFTDFICTEIFDGPFHLQCQQNLTALMDNGIVMVKSSFLGKTPDFTDVVGREDEYRAEWLRNLSRAVNRVRRGVLLLDKSVGYLERDAAIGGALEVSMGKRFVYVASDKDEQAQIMPFSVALRTIYKTDMKLKMIAAAYRGDACAIQGLLKARSHPNIEDVRGQTLLMRAAYNGDSTVMRLLIHAEAHVNASNKNGFSALHLASAGNHTEAVKALLKAHANIASQSYKGNSAMEFVKFEGHADCQELISEARKKRHHEAHSAPVPTMLGGMMSMLGVGKKGHS